MWMLISGAALACAGLVHAEGLEAESAQQEAIFDIEGSRTTVTYRVGWEGDAPEFGWLIPVPGDFVSLADADAERFDALREVTAPLVYSESAPASRGCSCGPTSKGDAANVAGGSPGGVIASGFTGTYDYVVLSADTPEELTAWLSENGWRDGGESSLLATYAEDEVVTLAALRLAPGAGDAGLPPIALTYDGGDVRFPSRLGQLAAGPVLSTTVWVFDDQPTTLTGWATTDLDHIPGGTDDEPRELIATELESLSVSEATLARTYVGSYDDRVVTRFDTRTAPVLHTADAVFVPDADARDFILQLELLQSRNVAWLLPLFVLPLAWGRRRR